MEMKKLLLKFLLVLLLVSMMFLAEADLDENMDLGWYDVADWEVAVCSAWGGIANEQQAVTGESSSSEMAEYTSLTISATLQAELLETDEDSFDLPEGTKVYAISWYMQPVTGSVNYKVTAYYENSLVEVIEDSSATPDSNYDGYFVKETDMNMTHVVLEVTDKDITIEVPVIG